MRLVYSCPGIFCGLLSSYFPVADALEGTCGRVVVTPTPGSGILVQERPIRAVRMAVRPAIQPTRSGHCTLVGENEPVMHGFPSHRTLPEVNAKTMVVARSEGPKLALPGVKILVDRQAIRLLSFRFGMDVNPAGQTFLHSLPHQLRAKFHRSEVTRFLGIHIRIDELQDSGMPNQRRQRHAVIGRTLIQGKRPPPPRFPLR